MANEPKLTFRNFFSFLISKLFLKHLAIIALVWILIIAGVLIWLNFYTHHGQSLELPDYRNMTIKEAENLESGKDFILIVDDSTHIVGKKGGIILDQNPKPLSKVKENRKVYLTVTKHNPDMIMLENLPSLYGRNYESKKKALNILRINTEIRGYKYDKSDPNNILETYYRGDLIDSRLGRKEGVEIEKGATLEFILSKKSGGSVFVPELHCLTLTQAQFVLESANLQFGKIYKNGAEVTSETPGYILNQSPMFNPETKIPMGSAIDITISDSKPLDCN